jgi:hypothetical protein
MRTNLLDVARTFAEHSSNRMDERDCPMVAVAVTLTLFGVILAVVADVLRHDGRKVIAALEGRSWASEAGYGRPVTIRFSRPYGAARPGPARPVLRAAA